MFNVQCWQAEKERRRERSGKPCDCGCGGVGLGANIDNIVSSSSEKNPDVRINIDNISPNETKKKNQDLRRAGNNVDNAVQRKALRDTVASNAINNSNNNTDNNNLSRVPAETKGHMVSCLSTLYQLFMARI